MNPNILKSAGILLQPTELDFESQAVLNPACILVNDQIHMYYRAVAPGNFSSIGHAIFDRQHNLIRRDTQPLLSAEFPYEQHGLEDPRITKIDDTYYMCYVCFDGENCLVAYAQAGEDLQFKKKGIISPQIDYDKFLEIIPDSLRNLYKEKREIYRKYFPTNKLILEKDNLFFPKKINGKYALMHRLIPDIQIAYFDTFDQLSDTKFWLDQLSSLDTRMVLRQKYAFENGHIGGGCPPIETKDGWIFIYHSVEETASKRTYHASIALLDLENPQKVIARMDHPFFSPTEHWEIVGDVNNVVFPSGAVSIDGTLHIYYGAADKVVARKSIEVEDLLLELKKYYQ